MPELEKLLHSLKTQELCPPFEIVAIDSGSTDQSVSMMRASGVNLTEIPPEHFRFGTTRQLAFSKTRGSVIVTLSQDAMPAGPGWLRAMTDPILDGSADIVQAEELAPEPDQSRLKVLHSVTAYRHWPGQYALLSCSGMAISRAAWLQTGFGDVPMSEDKYLGVRAWEKNLRVTIATDPPLLHGHAYTLKGHVKRCFNEGMGARVTGGYYSIGCLLRDLTRRQSLRNSIQAVFVKRQMSPFRASWYLLRPVFLYLGWRFGKGYWR